MVASRGEMAGAIVHHDRGSQYASRAYRRQVEAAKMKLSMSRKGKRWDNAVAESFFGTLEQELAPDLLWANTEEARLALSEYIHRCDNLKCRHSTLSCPAPVEFEVNHQASRGIAA
jgi:transposase InsO family protein